jgi:integrase
LPTVKRANLPAIRLYDLHHSVATLLLAADVNVKVVSERLGHEDITITLKHYARALPSMQQKAAAVIESMFCDNPTNVSQETRTAEEKMTEAA